MALNEKAYYVHISDSKRKDNTGKWKPLSEHENFESAFAAWKELFLSKEEHIIPYISKGSTTVFNGYDNIDDDEPILDPEAAKANALKNESWSFSMLDLD